MVAPLAKIIKKIVPTSCAGLLLEETSVCPLRVEETS